MNFQADDPTSPLFIGLLLAVLLDVIYAWSGIVRGELPNMHTSIRGARIAGVFSVFSVIFVFISYRFFMELLEFYGTISLIIAAGLFVTGIMLAERIPD